MATSGETALLGQRLDVGEQVEVFLAGQFQLAHAGRVDQTAAAGQLQQRAMGGGVAAATVVAAHLGRGHARNAELGVGKGRIARAGGTYHTRAVTRLQVFTSQEIGSAPCRESVCQSVSTWCGAGELKK